MHTTEWKKLTQKGYLLCDSRHILKDSIKETIKRWGGGVRPSDELPEHRQFLGQWKYPARYYNDRYALLYFYPSQQNTQYQEFWTPK